LQAQLKTAQANAKPKLLKGLAKPTQKKNCFLNNFQRFKKNKTPDTQARQKSTRQMTQTEDIKMVVTHDRQEGQPITAVWRNGGCRASYDSFVVGSSAVLRLNFCAKNPHNAKPQTDNCNQ
jgi:hypothetical protein